MKVHCLCRVVWPVVFGLVAVPIIGAAGVPAAATADSNYLSRIQAQIGRAALHALYPPNVP